LRSRGSARARTLLATTLTFLLLLPAGAKAAPIALGVFVPEVFDHPEVISEYGRRVGRQPAFVLSYKNWSIPPFYAPELENVWDQGAVSMVTWEPQTEDGKGIPLRDIVAGDYDRYIRISAEEAAAWGKPIMVRFAQEMNGRWYPWGLGVNGNTARQFREVWHHIFWIFRNHGADNVEWVWSPNEDAGGGHPLAVLYPGAEFVDWVGIDGFCWGGSIGWPSFTTIFASTYDRIRKLTSKPVVIAETAAGEEDGDKAAWIASAFEREAHRFPNVRAIAWFDEEDTRADFRVDSSPESLVAFRKAIAAPEYAGTRETLLATPSTLPAAAAAPEPPGGGYGAPSLLEELRQKLHGKYLALAIVAAIAVLGALIAVALFLRRGRRSARASEAA
jgi:hypothetical protein